MKTTKQKYKPVALLICAAILIALFGPKNLITMIFDGALILTALAVMAGAVEGIFGKG